VKGFKTLTLEANQAFESDENGVEEEVLTSYDVGLVTDMTETSINRNNFDQRENKQYAHIPFVTTGSTGSEIIGLGNVTFNSPQFPGIVLNPSLIGSDINIFTEANIIFAPDDLDTLLEVDGSTVSNISPQDPSSVAFADSIFFNNTFEDSPTFGQDVFLGTAQGLAFNNLGQPILALTFIETDSYPGFFNEDGDYVPGSTFDEFVFIKRNGFSEGDRMKGRFMEVKLKKRSRRLLEIFSGSATIFNSELSDD
jgi:hypothetical protein